MRFLSNDLSTVNSCDTLITELLFRFARRLERYTLPGAAASLVLEVTSAAITVLIALRLKVSACAITTGCRKPGPEPVGCGKSAHQISPRLIVIGSSSGSRTGQPPLAWAAQKVQDRLRKPC